MNTTGVGAFAPTLYNVDITQDTTGTYDYEFKVIQTYD